MAVIKPKRRQQLLCSGILIIITCVLIIASIVATNIYNSLVNRFVLSHDDFYSGGNAEALDEWKKFYGAEFRIKFYIYNVTNKDSLGWWKPLTAPLWKELGPYVYQEKRQRVPLRMRGDTADKVEYRVKRTFGRFIPELSNGSENDRVSLPFLPLVHTGHEKIFATQTVREWLWGFNGTDDIPFAFYNYTDGIQDTYKMLVSPTHSYGQIVEYNGQKKLSHWFSTLANSIQGTDGTFFTPDSLFFGIPSTLRQNYIYDPQFCRSLQLVHTQTLVEQGTFIHRYIPAIATLFESTPINQGFCNQSRRYDPERELTFCRDNYRIMDVRKCNNGTPYGMSWPHFLYDHPSFAPKMRGISEGTEEKHMSYIDIQPDTGIPLRIVRRSQVNLLWRSYQSSAWALMFKGYPEQNKVYPLFWTESGYDGLSQPNIEKLRLIGPISALCICLYVVSGLTFIAAALISFGRLGWCVIPGVFKLEYDNDFKNPGNDNAEVILLESK